MKISNLSVLLASLAFLSFSGCSAAQPSSTRPPAISPVVKPIGSSSPASELVGAVSKGGMEGAVLRVTTLAAKGDGSLRAALETPGPRVVVFEVGGVIDLEGRTLAVRSPYLTVAGQTAPDPGITLIRGGLIVETHDVVVQHLAVRPGDEGPEGREWAPDALGVRRGSSGPVHDVVFEHCSATWSIDENLSTSGPADVEDPSLTAHDITLRHCLIAEALSNATHPKGEHSKGTLVHDGVRNVLIEGCVYAHNRERNPRFKGGTTGVVRANVMYNWGSACVGLGARGNEKILAPAEVTIVGNVAIAGPDMRGKAFVKGLDPGGRAFVRDNLAVGADGTPLRISDDNVVLVEATASLDPRAGALRALRSAGMRAARRDPIDARIIASIIRGDGHIIDSQKQVGGYPVRAAATRVLEVPADPAARAEWLDRLSRELAEDQTLDVEPLWRRLAMR